MKKPTTDQLQNITFTVIVALVAVALYLLSGKAFPFQGEAAAPASPAPAAAVAEAGRKTAAAKQSATPSPAPGAEEEGFLAALADSLDVRALSQEDRSMRVSEKGERAVHADVYYSVQDGAVTGWTLRMEYPEKPKVKTKNSAIEQALLDSYLSLLPKRNSALKKMIPLLAAASGASKRIPGVAALSWYDGALSAAASGERYEDTQKGGVFSAYISMEGTERTLVCTFLFD